MLSLRVKVLDRSNDGPEVLSSGPNSTDLITVVNGLISIFKVTDVLYLVSPCSNLDRLTVNEDLLL